VCKMLSLVRQENDPTSLKQPIWPYFWELFAIFAIF
jgi:hypothetical protein